MQYISFRVQNFKGIKDTTVELRGVAGASVFCFVGLNESGKTTVLEAIHSFAADAATSELLGGQEVLGVPVKDRVPRHLLSEFTGAVTVTATLAVNEDDKREIAGKLAETGIKVRNFPDELIFERKQVFENGDFKKSYFSLLSEVEVKEPKKRKWSSATFGTKKLVRDAAFQRVPKIAYFPTFVFEFPKTIFLTDRGKVVDQFYRRVFQDILDFDGRGQTIEKDIVGRIHKKELISPWAVFSSIWTGHSDKDKIQQVVDRASSAVTKLVFGSWNEIFGEDTRGKEVIITYEVLEGESEDENGQKAKKLEHDVQVKFQIKDGSRRYDVNDRSLGFRWFFSFMLFTQFRVAREGTDDVPLLFLFDEPASNLHAAAQQKLIDSFPAIAKRGNVLAYSTHSHYMIEPKWLEQTFIVTNRADAPASSLLDEISLDDESLDVQVNTYRSFVNKNPSQVSYFQPILDRLSVVPSRFDFRIPSVVVEGRSDYYVLRYASRMHNLPDLPLIPGLGAGTFDVLAAFHVGWNLNFMFLLDGDHQGVKERERYRDEYGIVIDRLVILSELADGVEVIEDLLDEVAKNRIQTELKLKKCPSKGEIKRFFQERLASEHVESLGEFFDTHSKIVLEELKNRLNH